MRYSVCIIDDTIPASQVAGIRDTDLLNASNLELLLQQEALWTDAVIMNLVRTLLEQKGDDNVTPKWEVCGFTNPALYLNMLENGLPRFDIVVFDWEYPGTDSESILKDILEKTFCLVFVFSGAGMEAEIGAVLSKPEFQEYKDRLQTLEKTISGADQTDVLLQRAEAMFTQNFSFRFARSLRGKAVQVMDRILSELGRATLSDMKHYLQLEDEATKRDLVDFIAERFRSGLVVSDIPEITASEGGDAQPRTADNALIQKIWSYRLYLPIDNTLNAAHEVVRRGDIVRYSREYFLVVSADCDLKKFWHKNFGSINLVPLHRLHNSNSELREMLTFCVSPSELKEGNFSHLTDTVGRISDGPFILPFVKVSGGYESFVAMPKELTAQKIVVHADVTALPKKDRKLAYLKYGWWQGAEKMCSVSEPFATSIVQHVFGVIGGFGVPDYPNPAMKEIFKSILEAFVTVSPTTSTATTPSAPPALPILPETQTS